MANPQYVYHMSKVSKTYPGGKQVLRDISLSFLPGAKIGVVGINGAGKSTLLKIMAGTVDDFNGEAWAADGIKVGYLPQEPELDPDKDVMGNAMEGVAEKKAMVDRFNEVASNYSEETADEMAELQDQIDALDLWDLDSQVEQARLGTPTWRSFQVVRNAASHSRSFCCQSRISCCWTSRPTISTPKAWPGLSAS